MERRMRRDSERAQGDRVGEPWDERLASATAGVAARARRFGWTGVSRVEGLRRKFVRRWNL